jgi:hypothetical protein
MPGTSQVCIYNTSSESPTWDFPSHSPTVFPAQQCTFPHLPSRWRRDAILQHRLCFHLWFDFNLDCTPYVEYRRCILATICGLQRSHSRPRQALVCLVPVLLFPVLSWSAFMFC